MHTQTITRDDVIAAIEALPADKLVEVYDFARFLAERSTAAEVEPTEAELATEDAKWEATYARHADKFDALAAQAEADIDADKSLPMFDEDGRWLVDGYINTESDKAATKTQ